MLNFFKKKEFTVRPILNREEIQEALIDISYNIDQISDYTKGIHIDRLRERFGHLLIELKDYCDIKKININ